MNGQTLLYLRNNKKIFCLRKMKHFLIKKYALWSWEFGSEMFLIVMKICRMEKKKILMVKYGWHQVQQGNGKDDCIHTFPKHILFHNREDKFSKLARQILTWWDWWPLDEWRAPKYTCRRLGFTLIYFYYLFVEIS